MHCGVRNVPHISVCILHISIQEAHCHTEPRYAVCCQHGRGAAGFLTSLPSMPCACQLPPRQICKWISCSRHSLCIIGVCSPRNVISSQCCFAFTLQLLTVTLEKHVKSLAPKFDYWRSIVPGQPEIDTHQIVSESQGASMVQPGNMDPQQLHSMGLGQFARPHQPAM